MNYLLKKKKSALLLLFLGFAFQLFIALTLFSKDLHLGLSFCINALFIFIIIFKNINTKDNSIALNSICIFILLFFIVAPVIQISSYIEGSKMVNNLPYNSTTAFLANLQISLFIIIFFLSYFYIKTKPKTIVPADYSGKLNITLLISTVLIGIIFAKFIINNLFKIDDNSESIIASLILRKSLFMIPVAAFSIYLYRKNKVTLILMLIVLIILFLKNPISERRNAIGPFYLALTFFYFKFLYKTNFTSFIYIFIIFFFFFPLSGLLTNSYSPVLERIDNLSNYFSMGLGNNYFKNYFTTLHYDAWSNICATIEYVHHKDLTMGYQLLGSLLFFIPRFMWPSKPIGSGHFIAEEFLMPNYSLWLSNISCPIISEGYLNFGVIGIVLFAFLLAVFVKNINSWLNSEDVLFKIFGIYASFWLFYLMRGDLMSSWAYLFGAFIGIIIIPKFINKIINNSSLNLKLLWGHRPVIH
ncbi:MAG TPA: O-antigen polysaccharide polymerase Wzy [Prolixibacteraceae bacterium]|nr:O-antigen polysaccharide polymerase Wzy [Prolixibacteraceae bacterium]